jgi:hypothetical protein
MVMCSLFRAGSLFGAPKSKSDFIYRGDESDWSFVESLIEVRLWR